MLLGDYEIGDTMTIADQYFEYDVCYGEYTEEVFKFADNPVVQAIILVVSLLLSSIGGTIIFLSLGKYLPLAFSSCLS